MKAILLAVLFVFAPAVTLAADSPSIAGQWQVHVTVGSYDNVVTCAFSQKDAALSGTCSSDNGTMQVTGNVSENKVTWNYKMEYNGSPITVSYDGTVESANKISGSVSVAELGASGDFTATPSAQSSPSK